MRWLLRKDLLILRRSRLLVAVLVVYPVLIALLIGFAISRSPSRPRVALVNLTPPGETFTLGGRQLQTGEYANEFLSQVDAVKVATRAQALAKVRSGEVLAAVVIPADIIQKITTGTEQGLVEVLYNGNALQQSFVHTTLAAALSQANLALSQEIRRIAVQDLDLLLSGGELPILGASRQVMGLGKIAPVLRRAAARQPPGALRRQLNQIASFADFAARNLGVSADVLKTVSQPITVHEQLLHGRRTPLDTFAVVVAVAISLMFVCVLLAAGSVALEREEHSLARLLRGPPALVSHEKLLSEKVLLATICAFALAFAMLAGVSAFVSLSWGRVGWWVIALAAGGVAFGALGVAIGVLAREVRAASLLAFLLTLPLAFLALVPAGAVAAGLYEAIRAISFVFPFKPALEALDAAVNGASPAIGWPVLHLMVLALAFTALARLGLRRLE